MSISSQKVAVIREIISNLNTDVDTIEDKLVDFLSSKEGNDESELLIDIVAKIKTSVTELVDLCSETKYYLVPKEDSSQTISITNYKDELVSGTIEECKYSFLVGAAQMISALTTRPLTESLNIANKLIQTHSDLQTKVMFSENVLTVEPVVKNTEDTNLTTDGVNEDIVNALGLSCTFGNTVLACYILAER